MQGNDLSNSVPMRTLVHVSAVFTSEIALKKTLIFVRATTAFRPDLRALNPLVRSWDRGGMVFDLFHYSNDGYPAKEMYALLEDVTHPFRGVVEFTDYPHLHEFCAYSSDVYDVIDPLHPMGFSRKLLPR